MIGLDCLANMGEPRINPPSYRSTPFVATNFLRDASRALGSVWTSADLGGWEEGVKLHLRNINEMSKMIYYIICSNMLSQLINYRRDQPTANYLRTNDDDNPQRIYNNLKFFVVVFSTTRSNVTRHVKRDLFVQASFNEQARSIVEGKRRYERRQQR